MVPERSLRTLQLLLNISSNSDHLQINADDDFRLKSSPGWLFQRVANLTIDFPFLCDLLCPFWSSKDDIPQASARLKL
jgi:hypothetical protein